MTRAQALRLARAKWGDSAAIRYSRRAALADARREAAAELAALRDGGAPSDPKALGEWRERCSQLREIAMSRPYDVGYVGMGGLMFSVQGWGDSWEAACRRAGLLGD